MAERMAEINVEKVSSIKTVVSFNHQPEIILKARVNILPPVVRVKTRSLRDEDFRRRSNPHPGALFSNRRSSMKNDRRN